MQKSVATIKQLLRDVQAGRGRPKRGRPKKAPDEHEIARVPYYMPSLVRAHWAKGRTERFRFSCLACPKGDKAWHSDDAKFRICPTHARRQDAEHTPPRFVGGLTPFPGGKNP